MKRDDGAFGVVFVWAALIFLIGVVPIIGDTYSCHSKWDRTAQAVEYGPVQGCMIKINGRWVPAENYREVP
jgi:hypothetical protein